jgi:hypothetical protein
MCDEVATTLLAKREYTKFKSLHANASRQENYQPFDGVNNFEE